MHEIKEQHAKRKQNVNGDIFHPASQEFAALRPTNEVCNALLRQYVTTNPSKTAYKSIFPIPYKIN